MLQQKQCTIRHPARNQRSPVIRLRTIKPQCDFLTRPQNLRSETAIPLVWGNPRILCGSNMVQELAARLSNRILNIQHRLHNSIHRQPIRVTASNLNTRPKFLHTHIKPVSVLTLRRNLRHRGIRRSLQRIIQCAGIRGSPSLNRLPSIIVTLSNRILTRNVGITNRQCTGIRNLSDITFNHTSQSMTIIRLIPKLCLIPNNQRRPVTLHSIR